MDVQILRVVDEVVGVVLVDDLELVPGWHAEGVHHRALDTRTYGAEVAGRLAGAEVDSDEWHRTNSRFCVSIRHCRTASDRDVCQFANACATSSADGA